MRFLPVQRKKKVLFTDVRIAGYIAGGDWDQKWPQSGLISDRYHYIGFIERYIEGKEWEDTLYYSNFNNQINKRGYSRAELKHGMSIKKPF